MEEQDILEQLLAVLVQNGIKVRYEPIGLVPAGLCKIKGKTVFFVDKNAEAAEITEICARAVLETIDIQNIYLKPQIREFLEKKRPINGP